MNAIKKIFLLLGVSCVALVASAAPAKTTMPPRPARMQMVVNVPATMNVIRSDDIADAFAYRVASTLHEQGFAGRIDYVRPGDDPKGDVAVLEINLIEWRVDRIGNVDCTFSASVSSPRGKADLGLFSGTSMMLWPRRDLFSRADSFDDAVRSAVDDLSKKIEKTNLVPVPGVQA